MTWRGIAPSSSRQVCTSSFSVTLAMLAHAPTQGATEFISLALDAPACSIRSRDHDSNTRFLVDRTGFALVTSTVGSPLPALRRPVPRRARRVDGRRRAARPSRPTSACPPTRCNGSSAATSWATAGCCCSAAAPPTCSAGAGCSWSPSPCSPGLAARRPRRRRRAAHREPASSRAWPPRSPPRPACPSSPRRSTKGPARNKAISIFAVFGASGYSAGLVLSGLLTEVGWRWTFLLPAPIALVVLRRRRGS